jgi:hypothetical protein
MLTSCACGAHWFVGYVNVGKEKDRTVGSMEDSMRATGTILAVDTEPTGRLADEAKTIQKQKQERKIIAAEKRQERYDNAPNRICYAELYAQWKARVDAGGSRKLPKCNRCRAILHWEEHHTCPGFIPRYRDRHLSPEERKAFHEAQMANDGDWDDDQYDPTTLGDADCLMHEAETGETRDQVVIEGMTEDEYLMQKFGYIPPCL